MENVTKFTEEELKETQNLQSKFQENIVLFGQIYIEKLEIESKIADITEVEKKAREDYVKLLKDNQTFSETLFQKYGEGKLNLKDGTFTKSVNPPKS